MHFLMLPYLIMTIAATADVTGDSHGLQQLGADNAYATIVREAMDIPVSQVVEQKLEQEMHYYLILIGVVMLLVVIVVAIICFLIFNRRRIQAMKQEQKLSEARKYISGLESERNRLAKDLHDGVSNDLLGLEIKLSSYDKEQYGWIADDIAKIRNGVRYISHELMPPEFSRLGLEEILSFYVKDVVSKSGIKTELNTDGSLTVGVVSEHVALEVYRIVQELLSNILKHSSASRVIIDIRSLNSAVASICITDDGIAWSGDAVVDGSGVKTVADRAVSIGATIEYKRSSNQNIKCIIFDK
jgi:signal transduction histidine kinase